MFLSVENISRLYSTLEKKEQTKRRQGERDAETERERQDSRVLGSNLRAHVTQAPNLARHPIKLVHSCLGTLYDLGQPQVFFLFQCHLSGGGGKSTKRDDTMVKEESRATQGARQRAGSTETGEALQKTETGVLLPTIQPIGCGQGLGLAGSHDGLILRLCFLFCVHDNPNPSCFQLVVSTAVPLKTNASPQ